MALGTDTPSFLRRGYTVGPAYERQVLIRSENWRRHRPEDDACAGRNFIKVVAGSAVVWPFAAHAEQPDWARRVGVLMGFAESDPIVQPMVAAFRGGLLKPDPRPVDNFVSPLLTP